MRFSQKVALRVGAVGVAAAAIVVPSAAAFGTTPPPSITVTPSTGLHDGDTVTVTGQNFPDHPGHPFAIVQCSSLQPDGSGCNTTPSATGTTDGAGNIPATSVVVHTGTVGNGTCKPGSTCFLVASSDPADPTDLAAVAEHTIKFAALPSVTVKPAKGVHNHQKVTVSGRNFPKGSPLFIVECSGTSGASNCDTNTLKTSQTDASGAFTAKIKVHTGTVGNGKCKPGGKCYVAASTSTTPSPTTSAAGTFKFAKTAIATKTSAAFVSASSKIAGKVKAGRQGCRGSEDQARDPQARPLEDGRDASRPTRAASSPRRSSTRTARTGSRRRSRRRAPSPSVLAQQDDHGQGLIGPRSETAASWQRVQPFRLSSSEPSSSCAAFSIAASETRTWLAASPSGMKLSAAATRATCPA